MSKKYYIEQFVHRGDKTFMTFQSPELFDRKKLEDSVKITQETGILKTTAIWRIKFKPGYPKQ